jgi:hypothetical protein
MELYKFINNEALDEDLKAKREVLERLKRQVRGVNEEVVEKKELNKVDINMLNRYILSLNASIDDVFFSLAETKKSDILNLGEIPYKYNLLVNFIKSIGYNSFIEGDKRIIDDKVKKLVPKLKSLENLANERNFVDKFMLPKIIENIINKSYDELLDVPEVQKDILQIGVTERGRPKKYATKAEAQKAKLEQQKLKRQQAKLAKQKAEAPAQAQVEAEEPEDEDEEDEGDDYEAINVALEDAKAQLKQLKKQKKSLSKSDYEERKAELESAIEDYQAQLDEYE